MPLDFEVGHSSTMSSVNLDELTQTSSTYPTRVIQDILRISSGTENILSSTMESLTTEEETGSEAIVSSALYKFSTFTPVDQDEMLTSSEQSSREATSSVEFVQLGHPDAVGIELDIGTTLDTSEVPPARQVSTSSSTEETEEASSNSPASTSAKEADATLGTERSTKVDQTDTSTDASTEASTEPSTEADEEEVWSDYLPDYTGDEDPEELSNDALLDHTGGGASSTSSTSEPPAEGLLQASSLPQQQHNGVTKKYLLCK